MNEKLRRFSVEERQEVVAEYERSGLTQAAFVERRGISLASLTNWLRAHRSKEAKALNKEVGFRAVDMSGLMERPKWTAEVVMPDGSVVRLGAEAKAALAVGLVKVLRRTC